MNPISTLYINYAETCLNRVKDVLQHFVNARTTPASSSFMLERFGAESVYVGKGECGAMVGEVRFVRPSSDNEVCKVLFSINQSNVMVFAEGTDASGEIAELLRQRIKLSVIQGKLERAAGNDNKAVLGNSKDL
jgi:hypothetical protein